MGALAALLRTHRRVGLDTSVFIYHFEASARFAAPAGVVLDELTAGAFEGISSLLTIMELTVKPLQLGRPEVAVEYQVLLDHFPHLTLAPLSRAAVLRAAQLRAEYRLSPADALQVAACLEAGATAMVTNDRTWRRLRELAVILLEDFAGDAP